MQHFLSSSELLREMHNAGFARSTREQIARDFARSSFDDIALHEGSDNSYEGLLLDVESALTRVVESGERNLLQLLYHIDVPENDFLQTTSSATFLNDLSRLIIRREAYKVFLRSRF